jgi:type II secretory pathway pseudopilin PulG
MNRRCDEEGYTLIEILAGLAIGTVILGVVVYSTLFELDSLGQIRAQNEVNASVQFVDQVLQRDIQNLTTASDDPNYSSGTAIIGTDTTGSTVSIRLEDSSSALKIGSTPMIGFVVSVTPNTPNARTTTTHIRGTETSFSGSTLHVVGGAGSKSRVVLHLAATYIGPSPNQSTTQFVIDTSYAVGGGY